MKKQACFLVFFLIFNASGKAQNPDSLKIISLKPEEFRKELNIAPNHILADVREFFEYRKSRIRTAINLPAAGNLQISADTIDKSTPMFFYCTSGFRSKRVAKSFAEKGFRNVYSLEGGITGWKKEGFQVERKRLHKK